MNFIGRSAKREVLSPRGSAVVSRQPVTVARDGIVIACDEVLLLEAEAGRDLLEPAVRKHQALRLGHLAWCTGRVVGAVAAAGVAGVAGRGAGAVEGFIASVPMMVGPSLMESMLPYAVPVASYAQAGACAAMAGGWVMGQRRTAWFRGLCTAQVGASAAIFGGSAASALGGLLAAAGIGGAAQLLGTQDGGSVFLAVYTGLSAPLTAVGASAAALWAVRALHTPAVTLYDDPLECDEEALEMV